MTELNAEALELLEIYALNPDQGPVLLSYLSEDLQRYTVFKTGNYFELVLVHKKEEYKFTGATLLNVMARAMMIQGPTQ